MTCLSSRISLAYDRSWKNYSDLVEFQARSNPTTSHVIASQSDIVANSDSISNDLDSCNTHLASDTNKVIATSQLCIPSVKNTSHSNAVSILKDDSQHRRDIDTSVAIVNRVPTSAVSRLVQSLGYRHYSSCSSDAER